MTRELRRFCIKIEPRRELELFMLLSKRGTITADMSDTVLWAGLPMTEAELEGIAGVVKAKIGRASCRERVWCLV